MKYNSIPKDQLDALSPPDRHNLKVLAQKLEQSELDPHALGEILPEAVLSGEKHQNRISKSLVQVTEKAISYSIARDPEKLSTALFPIIGSSIKKAVQNMMNEMMTALNASMENLFSYKRMLWRIESIKTGIPLMDIVLKNTMQYRVEHVFLIHRNSSLLLHHISIDNSFPTDSDIVASMLSAVQDYIKDSLALDKQETVHSISTGEYTILIEYGPKAIIASVVKGVLDASLQDRMLESLEAVHLKLSSELASFDGDTGAFQREEALLRPCLISRINKGKKKPVYGIVLLSVFALILGGMGVLLFQSAALHRGFISELNSEPGILVASDIKKMRGYEIRVLKDSRSRSIESIALSGGIKLEQYNFILEEFISPAFGELDISEGPGIPGVLLNLSRELQEQVLLFEQDSGTIRDDQQQALIHIGDLAEEILTLSVEEGLDTRIELIGHSAGSVQDTESIQVSQDRASRIFSLLEEKHPGLSENIQPIGLGIISPVVKDEINEEDRMMNRSVTFNVIFE